MIVCIVTLIITMLLGGTQSGGFLNRSYAWIRGHHRPKTDERLGLFCPVPSLAGVFPKVSLKKDLGR